MKQMHNIPKGWKYLKLMNLVTQDIKNGYSPNCPDEPNGSWILSLGNITENGLDQSQTKPAPMNDDRVKDFLLEPGDFLISRSNTLDKVGRTVLFRGEIENCSYPDLLMRFRVDETQVINEYLEGYLKSSIVRKYIQACASGTSQSMVKINKTVVEKIPVVLPPRPEQKAIANLFSTWDEAIERTERMIIKKQQLYEAQLSKRLYLDVSERISLKKCLKEISSRNRDFSITQVLSVTNSKGFVRPEDQFNRQVASDNLSNYKIVSKGEYAYNPSRINVGSIARLDDWDLGVLSPMYTVFEINKSSELHTDLFLHWLNSREARIRIKLSSQGSVRETVSFDDFCAIGFPKIDFKEQEALAEYFNLILSEIDFFKALLEKYKTQKRGLMQKMLTGEWRIKPDIINHYMEA
ncbi:MAG: restriction endonuclease subunit S [Sphaerochaeta sp.]|nr:restriction endonuclease subunit S [Sphaerochaeta sp.]